VLQDARNCYVRSEGRALAAVVGVEDVVVVATDDAVLVAHRDHAQAVKALSGLLAASDDAEQSRIRHLTLPPGASISLERHFNRAEHWIVVQGTAQVTRDGESILVAENESVCIPPGTAHRLDNPGCRTLSLVEVRTGRYLEDDDVEFLPDLGTA
jgi:mannose-6-phosphate isomerase-like protein (cupin superfamily)